jgi:hypothetical protein
MKTSTILLIVVSLVLAGGVYWYMSLNSGNQAPLTTTTADSAMQSQYQALASQLAPVSFDTSIFAAPKFKALIDLAVQVEPETLGRLDPFAPLPGIASNQ